MAYKEEDINAVFESIIDKITTEGASLRSVLSQPNMPSSKTFYQWLESDEEKRKQYTRACEDRADLIFDEILDIADENNADVYIDDAGDAKIDGNTVQRSRLKIDARKWMLSKMNPKKYGDKIDHTTNGESIQPPVLLSIDPLATYEEDDKDDEGITEDSQS